MTATKPGSKERQAAIEAILNAPDLPSKVREHRARNGAKSGRRDDHLIPPAWRVAIEVGEDRLYPDPPNGKAKPLDTVDKDFLASNPQLDIAPALLPGITPYTTEEPWGMMEGESSRDYQLFSYYRALGLGRTKAEVAAHFKIMPNSVYLRAKENDWDRRCRAWDVYREQIYTLELVEETRTMAKLHGHIAAQGIEALAAAFEELVTRKSENPAMWRAELDEIPTRALITIAQRSAQVIPNLMNAERLSRGLPTELIATHTTSDQTITLQTSGDLAEILSGLFGVIGGSRPERPDRYIDAVVVDESGGEGEAD